MSTDMVKKIKNLRDQGNLDEIIKLVRALSANDYDMEVRLALAEAYKSSIKGRGGELAIKVLFEGMEQGEKDWKWNLAIAETLFDMDEYQTALPYFEKCAELEPSEENKALVKN